MIFIGAVRNIWWEFLTRSNTRIIILLCSASILFRMLCVHLFDDGQHIQCLLLILLTTFFELNGHY